MKSIRNKKQVLDNSMLEEEFFEDVILLGIVCALPSYQLIWHINQAFNYQFGRNHEFEIEVKGNFYEVYTYEEHEKMIGHTIYTNRRQTSFLLEEAKNIDFIWMIKGAYLPPEYADFPSGYLNRMKYLTHSFVLNTQQLKSKHLLIL
jgi:hypothetical protein